MANWQQMNVLNDSFEGFDIGWPDWPPHIIEEITVKAIEENCADAHDIYKSQENWPPEFVAGLLRKKVFSDERLPYLNGGADTPISFNDMHDRVEATIKSLQVDYAMSGELP